MVVSIFIMANTIKLATFGRREEIGIMKMVGATRSFIRAPFLVQAFFQGIFAAIMAIIMLLAVLFVIRSEFMQMFEIFSLDLLLVVMGIVIASGVVICLSSTWFVVGKLVSLSKDELYF